jgi:hypothetical protein
MLPILPETQLPQQQQKLESRKFFPKFSASHDPFVKTAPRQFSLKFQGLCFWIFKSCGGGKQRHEPGFAQYSRARGETKYCAEVFVSARHYSSLLRGMLQLKQMTFSQWVSPLLDYYRFERDIFTEYIRPNKRGTFSVRNAPEAQARFGVSARYLYKIRDRAEALATLYEVLVQSGVIS